MRNALLLIKRTLSPQIRNWLLSVGAIIFLTSCLSLGGGSSAGMYTGNQWAILPATNLSGVAGVHKNLESFIESNLRARGVQSIASVKTENVNDSMATALESGMRYAVKGTVKEWGAARFNGRKAKVHVQLEILDVATGKTIWKDEHSTKQRGFASLSGTANRAIAGLVNNMNLVVGVDSTYSESSDVNAVKQASVEVAREGNSRVVSGMSGFRTVSLDKNGFATKVGANHIGKSVAIYYAANPPITELSQFDRIVLEPDNIKAGELKALKEHGAKTYAYLSVGEVGPTRAYAKQIREEWILGENVVWNSKVLDLANPDVVSFLLQRIDVLMRAGYSGLFLDTMDSYQIYAKTKRQRARQEAAIGQFIRRVKQQYPSIRLISNRGFEVLAQTGPHLEAIAAESLYASWNNSTKTYEDVPASDREWLLGKLNTAKKQFGLDVISIEYLPPERREEARQVANSVAKHGFTPWVSTPGLDYVGVGLMEVMPRKVIMLFDSRLNGLQERAEVHELIAPIIEYYGYVPEYLDVAVTALPVGELKGQVAGIVTWSSGRYVVPGLSAWFQKQVQSDIPIAIFGSPVMPIDGWLANKLGIAANPPLDANSLKTSSNSALVNYEISIPARVESVGFNAKSTAASNQVHLSVTDKNDVQADLVVTGDWGGYAAHPAASNVDLNDTYYWVTNPFAFLEKALRLQKLPMPDVTTENGNRLWSSHIDGDALPSWAEMPGRKLGAEVIYDEILEPYRLPHSISIVEGEMTSVLDYADRRNRMFDIAKKIFAMPEVEIATHTFSHPYAWDKVGKQPGSGVFNLNVGDYNYTPQREISGSAKFINDNLAPSGKKTALMLWSGNALPDQSALAESYNSGLVNLNGGYTTISKAYPAVSRISPMARTVGKYVQAYAPIMNENVYTNEWLGPFDGFRRVIETLEMTDKPRRFKPLSIYYHFYAGTKQASIRSLEEIYDWSLTQDIFPVHASYYAKKVPDFRRVGVSRYIDGNWKLSGLGHVRSIRVLDTKAWPELASSAGLIGVKRLHDGIYIHTNGSDKVVFQQSEQQPSGVYVVSSNAHVNKWAKTARGIEMQISGDVPIELELSASARGCSIQSGSKSVSASRTPDNTMMFRFSSKDTGNAILNCQA